MGWLRRYKWIVATVFLIVVVLIVAGVWFWHVLASYIDPKGPTGRKDLVQGFAYVIQVLALILAGIAGTVGAVVALSNVRIARRNLEHNQKTLEHNQEALRTQINSQRELEDKRTQDAALQSYFEHMGSLLTDHDLIGTDRDDIGLLAQAQTLTVLAQLDGSRKGSVLRFLHGGRLIDRSKLIILLAGADLSDAELVSANLDNTNLGGAFLVGANFTNTILSNVNLVDAFLDDATLTDASLNDADLTNTSLSGTNLANADLSDADLSGADLAYADLTNAEVTKEQLATCESLEGATMPNGQNYEDWVKATTMPSGQTYEDWLKTNKKNPRPDQTIV